MGMNLIGFILTGPLQLDETKAEQAKQRVATFNKVLAALAADVANDTLTDERAAAHCAEAPWVEDYAWAELYDVYEYDYKVRATLVDDLFELWNKGARDAMSREHPDSPGRIIVAAGDSSWGDEPEGFAYQTLKNAEFAGLFDLFDIR